MNLRVQKITVGDLNDTKVIEASHLVCTMNKYIILLLAAIGGIIAGSEIVAADGNKEQ